MSNLIEHAKKELELAGLFDGGGDFYGGMTGKSVMELIEVFAKQGHSGMSAPGVISLFSKVANFEPIIPITGADDEWNEIGENEFQNKRLSAIFKRGKEAPYYLNAIVWREKDGVAFSGTIKGISSRQNIRLPFLPKTFNIDVEGKEIIHPEQLEEVWKYYDMRV